jgi:hypothetical protein
VRGVADGSKRCHWPRRKKVVRPVLCESVWLLDLHATFSPAGTGSLAQALLAAHGACAADATKRRMAIAMDEPPPVCVEIDADRLALVLVNLIGNAVKHGRPGGGLFVGVDLEDARYARLVVDDDGPGIAPKDRERVFAFGRARLDRRRRQRHRGSRWSASSSSARAAEWSWKRRRSAARGSSSRCRARDAVQTRQPSAVIRPVAITVSRRARSRSTFRPPCPDYRSPSAHGSAGRSRVVCDGASSTDVGLPGSTSAAFHSLA